MGIFSAAQKDSTAHRNWSIWIRQGSPGASCYSLKVSAEHCHKPTQAPLRTDFRIDACDNSAKSVPLPQQSVRKRRAIASRYQQSTARSCTRHLYADISAGAAAASLLKADIQLLRNTIIIEESASGRRAWKIGQNIRFFRVRIRFNWETPRAGTVPRNCEGILHSVKFRFSVTLLFRFSEIKIFFETTPSVICSETLMKFHVYYYL